MNILLIMMLAIFGPSRAIAAESPTIDDVLGEIERAESQMTDISAKFRQETKLLGTGEKQVIVGSFEILRNPERFRIKYVSPVEQVVAFDGEWLTMYFPETGQAFRQKTTLADISRLIGIDPAAPTRNMRDNFDARLGECGDKSCKIIFSMKDARGEEKADGPDLTWRVRVSRANYMVEEAEMASDEIEMKIRIYQYLANQGIKAESLKLNLPPGTNVFDGIPQLFAPGTGGKERE